MVKIKGRQIECVVPISTTMQSHSSGSVITEKNYGNFGFGDLRLLIIKIALK